MSEQVFCPLCHNDVKIIETSYQNHSFYNCESCGKFGIRPDYLFKIDRDIYASYLYYKCNLFSNDNEKGLFFYIGTEMSFNELNDKNNFKLIKTEEVENWYPKNISERIDYILLALAKVTDFPGDVIPLYDTKIRGLLFIKRFTGIEKLPDEIIDQQYEYIWACMLDMGFIKNVYNYMVLLPEGYKRVDELQKNQSNSKQVFIAMAFSEDMKDVQEKIEAGIHKAGYIPHVMNKNEHNNQIVPEILYQIKQSKFVIAEFSTDNNGAYYEAGYASGLGKEVIHICKKNVFGEKGHFDIKQKSTILWENESEITEALYKRIEATVGLVNKGNK